MYAEGDFNKCQDLTSLTFLGVQIDDSLLQCPSKAVVNDNLPNLTHLVFNGSGSSVTGKFHHLLTGVATFICWPKLTHLDLTRCGLDQNDAEIVYQAVKKCAGGQHSYGSHLKLQRCS